MQDIPVRARETLPRHNGGMATGEGAKGANATSPLAALPGPVTLWDVVGIAKTQTHPATEGFSFTVRNVLAYSCTVSAHTSSMWWSQLRGPARSKLLIEISSQRQSLLMQVPAHSSNTAELCESKSKATGQVAFQGSVGQHAASTNGKVARET